MIVFALLKIGENEILLKDYGVIYVKIMTL